MHVLKVILILGVIGPTIRCKPLGSPKRFSDQNAPVSSTSGLPEESEDKRAHTKSEQETIRHEISSLMEAMKLEMEKNYRQGFQDLSNPVWPNENPNTSNYQSGSDFWPSEFSIFDTSDKFNRNAEPVTSGHTEENVDNTNKSETEKASDQFSDLVYKLGAWGLKQQMELLMNNPEEFYRLQKEYHDRGWPQSPSTGHQGQNQGSPQNPRPFQQGSNIPVDHPASQSPNGVSNPDQMSNTHPNQQGQNQASHLANQSPHTPSNQDGISSQPPEQFTVELPLKPDTAQSRDDTAPTKKLADQLSLDCSSQEELNASSDLVPAIPSNDPSNDSSNSHGTADYSASLDKADGQAIPNDQLETSNGQPGIDINQLMANPDFQQWLQHRVDEKQQQNQPSNNNIQPTDENPSYTSNSEIIFSRIALGFAVVFIVFSVFKLQACIRRVTRKDIIMAKRPVLIK